MTAQSDGESLYSANLNWLLRYRGVLASNLYAVFWPLYLNRSLHIALPQTLELISLGFLLSIVFEYPTGWLADRFSRRHSLLVGASCCMAGLAMCATSTHLGLYLLVGIVIDQLGAGLASGPDGALAAETAHSLGGKHGWKVVLDEYNDKRVNYLAVCRGAGGVIGGLLALQFGLRATLWAQVLVYGLAFVCAYLVVAPPRQDGERVEHLASVTWGIVRHRQLMATIIFGGAVGGLLMFSYSFLSIYFSQLHIGDTSLPLGWFGLVWSTFMVSPWVFRRYFGKWFKKYYESHELASLWTLAAVGIVSMVVAGSWISVAGLVAILGIYFINALQKPRMDTRLMQLAAPTERATVGSAAQFAIFLIAGSFSLLTGRITQSASFGSAIVSMGLLFGILAGSSLLLMTKSARSGTPPVAEGSSTPQG